MHSKTRSLILAALFAALTAIGAFLKIPLGALSLTLQFLFTAMAGVLLGPRWGAASQAVYVALGLAGLAASLIATIVTTKTYHKNEKKLREDIGREYK